MVCRSMYVWPFPEILSTKHSPENFPSLATMATRHSWMPFLPSLCCPLSLWNPRGTGKGVKNNKTTTITLPLSVLIRLLNTDWRYNVAMCSWLWPGTDCHSAATVKRTWSRSKSEKHMKNSCVGSRKGRRGASRDWYTGTKEATRLWNFRSFYTGKKVVLLLQKKSEILTH